MSINKYLVKSKLDEQSLYDILTCAKYSNIVYDENEIDKKEFNFFKNVESDVEYMIKKDEINHICYITFRGTTSATDWLHDLNILKVKPSFIKDDCKIHMGFNNGYMSVREHLYGLYKSKNFDKFVFSGHSYGAALCTLAALDCKYNNSDKIVNCITFGSPRVGNKSFVKLFNPLIDSSYRCVYEYDPITIVPSYVRFRHVNNQVKCKQKPTYAYLSDSILWFYQLCRSRISDHSINNYITSIEKQLEKQLKKQIEKQIDII